MTQETECNWHKTTPHKHMRGGAWLCLMEAQRPKIYKQSLEMPLLLDIECTSFVLEAKVELCKVKFRFG